MNEPSSQDGNPNTPAAGTRSFRKWQPGVTLTPEQTRRQTDVLRHAHQSLSSRDATVAFLNSYNPQLDGVPLQMALESDEGLLEVEQLLREMKGKAEPDAATAAAQRGSTADGAI